MTAGDRLTLTLIGMAFGTIAIIFVVPSYEDRHEYDDAKKSCAAVGMGVAQDFHPGPHRYKLDCVAPRQSEGHVDLW